MARTRMVTRTVNVSDIWCMVCNTETRAVSNELYRVGGAIEDNDTALKIVKKLYETDTNKIVTVTSIETAEECWGMLETEFLKYAKRLDNETRKVIEE